MTFLQVELLAVVEGLTLESVTILLLGSEGEEDAESTQPLISDKDESSSLVATMDSGNATPV